MNILLVEAISELGSLWEEHLRRNGVFVERVSEQKSAVEAINRGIFDVLLLDLKAPGIDPVMLSDLASFRQPDVAVIVVSATSFFSDGSVFNLMQNVCGVVSPNTRPDDMTAMVEHYGTRAAAGKQTRIAS